MAGSRFWCVNILSSARWKSRPRGLSEPLGDDTCIGYSMRADAPQNPGSLCLSTHLRNVVQQRLGRVLLCSCRILSLYVWLKVVAKEDTSTHSQFPNVSTVAKASTCTTVVLPVKVLTNICVVFRASHFWSSVPKILDQIAVLILQTRLIVDVTQLGKAARRNGTSQAPINMETPEG